MDLMMRRAALLRVRNKSILPSEYKEVEYLESEGTCLIMIPFAFHVGDVLSADIVYQLIDNVNNRWAAGELKPRTSSISVQLEFGYYYTHWSSNGYMTVETLDGSGITAKMHVYGSLAECINAGSQNYYVFGRGDYAYPCRIWYHWIAVNGTKAFNLVPCYRKSDNKPGMYDIINDTFYTNAGTGEFVLGPEV